MKSLAAKRGKLSLGNFGKGLQGLAMVLGLLIFCLPGFAQLNLGRIFGSITDQSGGAVAGATVTVLDIARGVSRPLVSDGAGQYDAPDLIPGTYTIRAEAKGFKIAEHAGVVVGVGKEARVDLTLQPGEQTQTITVTGDLPMVNTSNAELGGTLEQLAVQELPVEGRNYQYLAWTRPGVIMHPTEGQFPFVSDGVRNFYSVWLIDGLLNANMFVGGPSLIGGGQQNGDEATILPLDAIQEVNMIENPTAVYGDRPGAHINVGLKSGTNTVHGTAYAYGKDSSLAAKNPFIGSNLPKAPLALEQFGGSVGGPVKKDRVFYFANYEGQRYSVGSPRIAQEPTLADIGGSGGPTNSIPDAIFDILHNASNSQTHVSGGAPIVPVSALSLNLAGCAALAPGGVVNPSLANLSATAISQQCSVGTGIFGNAGPSQNELTALISHGGSDNGIIKVDVHVNDKNSLNFDWFSGGGNIIAAGSVVQPYWEAQQHTWANMGRAVWIWTPNSTWLNEFRFGYDYGNLPVYVLECDKPGIGPNYTALGFVAGTPACQKQAGGGDVLGGFPLTSINAFTQLGATNGNTQDNFQHYFSVLDNLSWTHGKHVVTAGIEDHFLTFEGDALTNGRGTLSFGTAPNGTAFTGASPLEDFLTGTTTSGNLLVGSALRTVEMPSYAAYVQDAWRAHPRVTVNVGLRYEYTGVLKDATGNNQLANFNPALGSPTGLFQETKNTNIYAPYPWNFEPRLGVAWDVFGNGKTVVHAGGSVMFESAPRLLNLLFVSSAVVSAIPTGFTFVNPDGSKFAGPGDIATGTLAETGGVPGATGNSLPWSIGNPVFNATPTALACGNGKTATSGGTLNPSLCVIQPYDLHDRSPYYVTQTLSIQHAFTNNLSLDVAYVGTKGQNLDSDFNINAPTTGPANTAANKFIEQARRPYNNIYPFYSNILLETHGEESNYNALQVTLSQRLSHGLSFSAGYTLQHNLDNSSTVMNPLNPILDYGNSTDNAPNSFVFTATYFVPGRKSPGQLLEGWQLNTSLNLLDGFSTNASDGVDDLSGTGVGQDRWTMSRGGSPRAIQIGGPGLQIPCYGVINSSFAKAPNCTTVATVSNMPALCQSTAAAEATNPNSLGTPNATGTLALQNIGCYFVGSTAIVPPAQGTFGTMARDAFYNHPFRNWDFSVSKNWKFKERYGVQFRAEFFNILNRTEYNNPATSLATPSSFGMVSSTPDNGNPVIGNGPRKVQLGLKLSF